MTSNAEEIDPNSKLLKDWKLQIQESEHDIFCVEMLVRVWEKAKSDQNSSQRVTLPVAF